VKELRTFLDAVSIIDQNLVTEALQSRSLNTLNAFRNGVSVKWHEAELAVYLAYIFGEINKCEHSPRDATNFCSDIHYHQLGARVVPLFASLQQLRKTSGDSLTIQNILSLPMERCFWR
jgi:hypothetical protein